MNQESEIDPFLNADEYIRLSHWNYRIIEHKNNLGIIYTIHEVYYLDDKIVSWTQDSIAPRGDTPSEVLEDMRLMELAFNAPVLRMIGDKLEEITI